MSRIHALKFLILQTLNKNKSQISGDLHIEIAKSLCITSKKECLIVTWMSKGNNKEITIYGKGRRREIIYVDDLLNVIYKMAQKKLNGFNAFNISGEVVSIKQLGEKLIKIIIIFISICYFLFICFSSNSIILYLHYFFF